MVTDNNDTENDSTKAQGRPGPNVAIGGDSINSNIIVGHHNTVILKSKPEQERAERNRRAMLEVVQNDWVEGVLEKSLYHETLIDLGLEERPDAVTRPWDVQVHMPDRPNRVLPPGTPIVQVFDEAQGELLILGAPGAGKTTMLLELARDAIARARQDDSLPIPVVFNLSSWTDPKQPLTAWLVDELINKYHTPKKVAQGWVDQDELLLLLDGLDEVRAENREACAQAINTFRQAHGLTMPLVVCSRIADYESLSTRLQLRGAVFLQPLTDEQIDAYFERAGPELDGARQAWRQDAELQELVRQPLILSIMTLAYRGATPDAIIGEQAGSLDTRRARLFEVYIQQMFTGVGRARDERYTPQETTHYLAWLAHKLIEHGQTIFLLENMRHSWLPDVQQGAYWLMTRLVVGLAFGLVGGEVDGLLGGLVFGSVFGLMGMLPGMLSGGLAGGLSGVLVGVVSGVLSGENSVEVLKWSWRRAFRGLLVGLVIGLWSGLWNGLWSGLAVGLWSGLLVGLSGGLASGLLRGLLAGLIAALVFGLVFGLAGGPVFALANGPVFALASALWFGGSVAINLYILRFLLHRSGHIPRNYEHFLEYAVERLFLRRVGGSYVFVHRLLMEHFAAMWGKI